MEPKYDFKDFEEIVERLRSKDGCPWDKEQTHSSLKKCLIEEAYEVVEGIDILEKSGDFTNLKEELGDVLLQVVMHSQIAKEEELFTMQDVIQEISKKMIRRHPHVFADAVVKNSEGVLKNWEEIKKEEKKERKEEDTLHQIPKAFPPLVRVNKVLKKAEKLYNIQQKEAEIINSMCNTIENIRNNSELENENRKKEQIGTLMLDISKLARRYQIDTDEALNNALDAFIETYEKEA